MNYKMDIIKSFFQGTKECNETIIERNSRDERYWLSRTVLSHLIQTYSLNSGYTPVSIHLTGRYFFPLKWEMFDDEWALRHKNGYTCMGSWWQGRELCYRSSVGNSLPTEYPKPVDYLERQERYRKFGA